MPVFNLRAQILKEHSKAQCSKIVKWVGVGFGVGYRIMLLNNPDIPDKLSSPLYVLRLKIFLDEVYRSIFPKKEETKKPPAKKK